MLFTMNYFFFAWHSQKTWFSIRLQNYAAYDVINSKISTVYDVITLARVVPGIASSLSSFVFYRRFASVSAAGKMPPKSKRKLQILESLERAREAKRSRDSGVVGASSGTV